MKRTRYFQNCLGVFQGGGCKAIAYAGAYEESINRGVFFSELVGSSAGSILAVLIGAGATPAQLYRILNELEYNNFLEKPVPIRNFSTPFPIKILSYLPKVLRTEDGMLKYVDAIKYLGMHNSAYIREWINEKLKELLQTTKIVTFKDLIIPTTVVATDLQNKTVKVWNSEDSKDTEVAFAVQSSCSIPLFFQPIEMKYVDGGLLSNLPSFVFKENPIYDKILAFTFTSDHGNYSIKSFKKFLEHLANTTIQGSVELQLKLQNNIHFIEIDTGDISATDFKKINYANTKKLVGQGFEAAKKFFDAESANVTDYDKQYEAKDIFQTFNLVTKTLNFKTSEVLICDNDLVWLYSLFPLIIKWKEDNAEIKILLEVNNLSIDIEYKKRLLKEIGCDVFEVDRIPFKGFIFNANKNVNSLAVIFDYLKGGSSKYYSGIEDKVIIRILRERFYSYSFSNLPRVNIGIRPISIDKIVLLLSKVEQYAERELDFVLEEVQIERLLFLSKYLKGYKYRQVDSLFKIYNQNNLECFEPAELMLKTKTSIITPPIIEKHGNELYVIDGNARFVYAHKMNLKTLKAIVVKGENELLPSRGKYNIKEILITDKEMQGDERYKNWNKEKYRYIERHIRDPKTSLK